MKKADFIVLLLLSMLPMVHAQFFDALLSIFEAILSFIFGLLCSIFGLWCSNENPPPEGCQDAFALQIGDIVAGEITNSSAIGQWYLFVGTGQYLGVTTCTGNSTLDDNEFDSFIDVTSGECGDLQLVDSNDNNGSCGNGKSALSFQSLENETYHVQVLETSGEPGSFGIAVFEIHPNINCTSAITLELEGVLQEELSGYGFSEFWYSFGGASEFLAVSTCTGNSTLDFDFLLADLQVYNGSCDTLEPVNIQDDYCGNGRSTVYFQSLANETYHVRLSTSLDYIPVAFGITLIEIPSPPSSKCEEAITLEIDDIVVGEFAVYPFGVWYSFVGIDGYVEVTTCTGNSTLDDNNNTAELDVYNGNCSNLQALFELYGSNSCGAGKEAVYFESEANETYFIKVYSPDYPSDPAGLFGITLFEITLPSNTKCLDAILLAIDETVEGEYSRFHDVYDGVWYSFAGTGGNLTVSTCTGNSTQDNNEFDSYIEISIGDCGNLQFVDNESNGGNCGNGTSTVSFLSLANETYYVKVRVTESSGKAGSFNITLAEVV